METLRGHLAAHGRPVALYSDRYSVFRVNRKDGEEVPTQFTRALLTLGIEPIHAGTPQAKGRLERANLTLRDVTRQVVDAVAQPFRRDEAVLVAVPCPRRRGRQPGSVGWRPDGDGFLEDTSSPRPWSSA